MQADRAAGRNLVLLFRGQFDDCDFLVTPRKLARHALVQAAKELLLFQRVQPDQNHHAIAEQYSETIRIDAKRKRCCGQDIAALEARPFRRSLTKKARAVVRVPTSGDTEAWFMEVPTAEPTMKAPEPNRKTKRNPITEPVRFTRRFHDDGKPVLTTFPG